MAIFLYFPTFYPVFFDKINRKLVKMLSNIKRLTVVDFCKRYASCKNVLRLF